MTDIKTIASALYEAEKNSGKIEKLSVSIPGISVQDAYSIQLEVVNMKLSDGDTIVGKKIGLTNMEMRRASGIPEPDYGHIMASNMLNQDELQDYSGYVQPHIEAELAFVLGEDLKGPGITEAQVVAATKGIIGSFEIVDCRYTDMKISLADTVADNASCGKIVLGSKLVPIGGMDLRTIGLVLERNGQPLAFGASGAVAGNPASAVAWLANKLAAYDVYLNAGEVIMSGSFTNLFPVAPGDCFYAHFGNDIGSVKVAFGQ